VRSTLLASPVLNFAFHDGRDARDLCLAACVYRIDIQQGNLLEDKDIGQSRSA
jgi:hypothetical protein